MKINIRLLILGIILLFFIGGCHSISLKHSCKQDSFILIGRLIDFDIAGTCGNEIHSGLFLFEKDNLKSDSLFVLIPCPNEEFFKRGNKYEIRCYIQAPIYIPLLKSDKFIKFKLPTYYSTMSKCKNLQ